MKSTSPLLSCLGTQCAFVIIATLLIHAPVAIADDESDSIHQKLIEKTKRLEERMSERFHNTWKGLRESVDAKMRPKHSLSSASVDVREQNDGYTIRLSLPGRDIEKVEVSMINGNQLRIHAPANGKSGTYEQIIVLNDVAATAKPEITKRPGEDMMVIHLVKQGATQDTDTKTGKTPSKPLPVPIDPWDRDILERMENMRREMDDMFQKSLEAFGDTPGMHGIFDKSRLGSSVELREEEGNYIVRAYLPDRDAKDIKVTVEDDRILKIEAEAEEHAEKKDGAMVMERKSHYLQSLTLPGPVDADKLKVDRANGMLIITLPVKPKT